MTSGAQYSRTVHLPTQAATERFAHELSLFARIGDVIALAGDLGTGKSTFARAFIRALSAQGTEFDVPSPTFTLVQTYDFTRLPVAHFDFYRVVDENEIPELGFPGLSDTMVLLAEWPERAETFLPADRLELTLEDGDDPGARVLTLKAHGSWALRAQRMEIISAFLDASGHHTRARAFLLGDASARRYERLQDPQGKGRPLILMDSPQMPDGRAVRDGLPYSQIAHLAENVTAFAAIDQGLREIGLAAPQILASDLQAGLLVIEDLGGVVFQDMVRAQDVDLDEPYRMAVAALVRIVEEPLPDTIKLPSHERYQVPAFDAGALEIEAELLLDWYWPAVHDGPAPDHVRADFLAIWRTLWPRLERHQTVWCLRDYHSPNLIWRADKDGLARLGIIDFQDAVRGHPAYDLASLLQDARVDIDESFERKMFDHYCETRLKADGGFDRQAFQECYAILAAQRTTKILGIFMRLKRRDGKSGYLQHIPRLWGYLDRTLTEPILGELKGWYDSAFPPSARRLDSA
ncbi:MAG: tRNA (adenosine(37)-N6)-threonylcarbamoyltransferase complex ATPase subunit type 1 TsaE [Pseudomonadota bacterium]